MNQPLEITLKTLTPLWTGGVDGTSNRLHATGIIGSLRWWYEAIVRGLGGKACDPSKGECTFDSEKYHQAAGKPERERLHAAGLCDVCQVFGATGWRRRFRLEVVKDDIAPAWTPPPDTLNVRPPGRSRGWYLPRGQVGQVTLRFAGDEASLGRLSALWLFLERWGSVGAKPQLGYGVFRLENRAKVAKPAQAWQPLGDADVSPALPDLRRFGLFRFRFSAEKGWWTRVPGLERLLGRGDTARALQQLVEKEMIPVAPALKDAWRFGHWKGPRDVERCLFGTSYDPRVRSKLSISWAYPDGEGWQVRGWVWLPEQDDKERSIDPRLLQQVWQGVQDAEIWQAALKVNGGALTCAPDVATWQPWMVKDVRNFLEDSR